MLLLHFKFYNHVQKGFQSLNENARFDGPRNAVILFFLILLPSTVYPIL